MTIKSVGVTAKAVASVGVCYATANASDKEIAEFFDWCVEKGAFAKECHETTSHVYVYNYSAKIYCDVFSYFGVNTDSNTYVSDSCGDYSVVVCTIEEAKDIIDPNWRKQEQKEEEMTEEQKAKKRVLEIVEKILDGDVLYCGPSRDVSILNGTLDTILDGVNEEGYYVLQSEIYKAEQEKEAKRNEILSQIASLQQQLENL